MPLLFTASIILTPADIHPASSPHSRTEWRGENRWMQRVWGGVNERVCLCGCACPVVYLCPRCPCGFSAGSSLIICIFSFELLFAALRAAPTPKGLQSNSVKRQVRHKLIIRHLRIIALACTCVDVNTHILYKYTLWEHRDGSKHIHTHTRSYRIKYIHTCHRGSDWIWKETKVEWESFQVYQEELLRWLPSSNF